MVAEQPGTAVWPPIHVAVPFGENAVGPCGASHIAYYRLGDMWGEALRAAPNRPPGHVIASTTCEFFWLLAAAVVIAAPAQADPARDALAEVAKCSDIPAAAERLQCYDAAAQGAKMAMSRPRRSVASGKPPPKPVRKKRGRRRPLLVRPRTPRDQDRRFRQTAACRPGRKRSSKSPRRVIEFAKNRLRPLDLHPRQRPGVEANRRRPRPKCATHRRAKR